MLTDDYERGVHGVTPEQFWALGAARGYDRRGLGNYFNRLALPCSRPTHRDLY